MNNKIGRTFTPWTLLKFAAPSIAMMIFMSLYTIVDGIFISRFIGSNALSSLNIVYPIINIVIAIATMLAATLLSVNTLDRTAKKKQTSV